MRDLGLPFMNGTIRDSVTNYHFFSSAENKNWVLGLESDRVAIKVIVREGGKKEGSGGELTDSAPAS